VFNLTGTVPHTQPRPRCPAEEAIEAIVRPPQALRALSTTSTRGRGDRDDIRHDLLHELTGAEAAVVNNNAAAVFLLLNTLARRGDRSARRT
jgi:L-seryl-tRNA(Ser) seleniumtransferase